MVHMKKQFLLFAMLPLLLMICVVQIGADFPSSLNSGYGVTTDWHGELVLAGSPINATAYTTDLNVTKVEFIWKDPDENVIWDVNVTVQPDGQYNGDDVLWANNSQTIYEPLGDWGIQAFFYDEWGHIRGQDSDIVAIRATSFEAVPEVPFGTIATILAFFGALATYVVKSKKPNFSRVEIQK